VPGCTFLPRDVIDTSLNILWLEDGSTRAYLITVECLSRHVHQQLTERIHVTNSSLPWMRQHLQQYSISISQVCYLLPYKLYNL